MTAKIEIEGKTRQNAESKQSFDLTRIVEINEIASQNTKLTTFDRFHWENWIWGEKLVKTLKVDKLLIWLAFTGKNEIEGKTRQNAENKQINQTQKWSEQKLSKYGFLYYRNFFLSVSKPLHKFEFLDRQANIWLCIV